MKSMIRLNGKTYNGNNMTIINGKIILDGKEVKDFEDEKVINIVIEGNYSGDLNVDSCNFIKVRGDVKGNIKSTNGKIECKNVEGDVEATNGNINCENIGHNVSNMNGNIKANNIHGSAKTINGSIIKG